MILIKIAALAVGTLAALVLSTTVAVGGVYAAGGVAAVSLTDHDSGKNLFVPLPAVLIEVAVSVVQWAVDSPMAPLEAEFGDDFHRLKGSVGDILDVVDELPDGVLVEVEDGTDRVRLAKQGSALVLEIDDRERALTVSLPARSVTRNVTRLLN